MLSYGLDLLQGVGGELMGVTSICIVIVISVYTSLCKRIWICDSAVYSVLFYEALIKKKISDSNNL